MKTKHSIFFFLLLLSLYLGAANAQVSNTRVDFSCPGQVVVTYDLVAGCPSEVDVALYYSPNNRNWVLAKTVSGDLLGQTTDTNKEIIWDNNADKVKFGKYFFKVEPLSPLFDAVNINGVCWAKTNLDVGGVFAANEYDYGALYQWGRQADGHESRMSEVHDGVVSGADLVAGQVATTSGASGKFIKNNDWGTFYDWRTPQDDKLWNSGDEVTPSKNTAADPCPAGWRVPTHTELSKLTEIANVTTAWTDDYNDSGITGRIVTDRVTNASIFLPSTGGRNIFGSLYGVGTGGVYWSSGTDTIYGGTSYFGNSYFVTGSDSRSNGFSIRCVSE